MIGILEDQELAAYVATKPDLSDAFLDWIGAAQDRLGEVGAGSQVPFFSVRSTGDLLDDHYRQIARHAPSELRDGVEEADETIGALSGSVRTGTVPLVRAQLPVALASIASDDLVDEARLALAGAQDAARHRIIDERFTRLVQAADDVASLGFEPELSASLVGRPQSANDPTRSSADGIRKVLAREQRGRGIFVFVNSKGIAYYLNSKKVTLRGGKVQTIYYFSKEPRVDTGVDLPSDRTVNENPRNGFLTLKRK